MGKGGKGKSMSWSAVVHVVLVQAHGLTPMDAGETSDPYCRISLGREKQKSKSISNTVNPKWREAFDFYWYEELDSFMEITIWDKDVGSKDDFMGRWQKIYIYKYIIYLIFYEKLIFFLSRKMKIFKNYY